MTAQFFLIPYSWKCISCFVNLVDTDYPSLSCVLFCVDSF